MTVTHLGDELQHFLRGFADSRQSGVGPQGLQPRQQYDKHITCQLHFTFWLQLFCKTYDTTTERTFFSLRYNIDFENRLLFFQQTLMETDTKLTSRMYSVGLSDLGVSPLSSILST